MQLVQPFDANKVDPTQGVGGLPIGKHPVVVDSSEIKPNKDGTGGFLQLNLKIIDGPQTGAIGAYRLNLYHNSQQTVEIAHKQLSAICHVTGVFQIQDSAQLHNIPFIVEVGPQKGDTQYTEVKKVFDRNGNEPGKAPVNHAAAQPAPAAQQAAQPAWNSTQPVQREQQPAWGATTAGSAPAQAAPAQAPAPQAAWAPAQTQQAPAAQQPAPAWQAGGQVGGATPPWGAR